MTSLNNIITRQYSNFMGVDFRGGEVPYYHSPDSLNMWRDYTDSDCIQTRPGMKLLNTFDNDIFGLFFYKIDNDIRVLVHSGVKLYCWENYPQTPASLTVLYEGLNPVQSKHFIYDGIFYFMDGINYLKYDGLTVKSVEGTIPTTSYFMNPDGSTDIDSDQDTDYIYQNVNCLTPRRRNRFVSDGISKEYHLDGNNIDNAPVEVELYDTKTGEHTALIEGIGFTVNRELGIITFNEIPNEDKQVFVLFSKTYDGYRDRILKCTKIAEFDNRIFLTGNEDYPQAIFWCSESDPEYFAEDDKLEVGIDLAPVKAIVSGNNVLWALKETSQNQASIYYLTPSINSVYGKYYTPVGGNVSLGCVSTGINFNDDIVYFSNKGLEGVNSNSMYSEQLIAHRSTFIDSKLLNEKGYENVKLAEYNGYLLCLIDSKIYLADKRKKINIGTGSNEYEWFYWELPFDINYMTEYRGQLYLGNKQGQLFVMEGDNDNELPINSYWTTNADNFGYPSYTKTTNKKGAEVNLKPMGNNEIEITTITDGKNKTTKTLSDAKGYAVFKIKDKKFFKIQYKFSSNKPFGIYSAVVQGFIAGYLKR